MIDGEFAPLDMLFSESQMLTILRSVPVGRYLQPIGDWNDGLDMPFVFVRDEIYMGVCLGGISWETAVSFLEPQPGVGNAEQQRLQVRHDGRTANCRQTLDFHRKNPYVERATFVLPSDTTTAQVQIVLLDTEAGDEIATGALDVTCSESCDTSELFCVDLFESPKILAEKAKDLAEGIQDMAEGNRLATPMKTLVGRIELQITLLSSRMMSSKSRWKVTHQHAVVDQLAARIQMRKILVDWRGNAKQNGHGKFDLGVNDSFQQASVASLPLPQYAEDRATHSNGDEDTFHSYDGDNTFHSHDDDDTFESQADVISDDEVELVMRTSLAEVEGEISYSRLHPLEQHTGGKECEQHWSENCACCGTISEHTGAKGVRWTAAHPLALQGYEDLNVMHADAWNVPIPDGYSVDAFDANVPPPVARVTAIYGVNVRTLRTIFLRHRDAHVTGGIAEKLEAVLQLDTEGDVDGLLCYDGQGFETESVPQIQQDTQEQVFLSGDGTVNYQSLRHCAMWEGSCDVQIFELPDCDHRGVSYDSRMLKLLSGVLGLEEREEQQTDESKLRKLGKDAASRVATISTWCSSMLICGIVAKIGFR